jgi:FkbM family methyltransferase
LIDWKFIARKYWRRLLRKSSRPEPLVWKEMKKIRGGSFIDVGANLGRVYSFPLHGNFRRTYAIEPNPWAADWMRREAKRLGISNDRDWGNMEVCEFAASNENGETLLYINSGASTGMCNGSADTIEPIFVYRPASNPMVDMKSIGIIRSDFDAYPPASDPTIVGKKFDDYIKEQGRISITVKVKKLDDWWGEAPIDLMKIDVEGAEFNVLQGAKRILPLVKNIVVELHDRGRKQELERVLGGCGFSTRWLDPDHVLGAKP